MEAIPKASVLSGRGSILGMSVFKSEVKAMNHCTKSSGTAE
jgi:hypothetical protein